MIKSMTGYGKISHQDGQRVINVEIKTLNGKQADVYLKMPAVFREVENEIRNLLIQHLQRGKIEATIWFDSLQPERSVTFNHQVILDYIEQIKVLGEKIDLPGIDVILPSVLRMPEILSVQKQEFNPEEWSLILALLEDTCNKVNDFRIQEGNALKNDLKLRIQNILDGINSVVAYEEQRKEMLRNRMESTLEEIRKKVEPDLNRFEQELIYYIERLDITEEKVRLSNHCNYFMETIETDPSPGRKLGFISQEMGREINTMGSKANHAEIQKIVVMMKDELEKIKEQSFNVL